jgi:hypothetical protein
MNSIFTLIFSSLAVLATQNITNQRQPDCNHESLEEARARHQKKH